MKRGVFWKVYTVLIVLSLAGIAYGLNYLWDLMDEFERSTPEYALKAVESIYTIENYDSLASASGISDSNFESSDVRRAVYESDLSMGVISYARLASVGGSDERREYMVRAGEEDIGSFSLVHKDGGNFGSWEIESEKLLMSQWGEVHILAPSNSTVTVNSVPLSAENKSGEDSLYSIFKNLPEYMTQPSRVQYSVYGFYAEPTIEVRDEYGELMELTVHDTLPESMTEPFGYPLESHNEEYSISYVTVSLQKPQGDMAELEEMIFSDALGYSKFVTADYSFFDISHRFVIGSEAYTNLQYLDTQFNAGHASAFMRDETVNNMFAYNSELFSVEVDYVYELEMWGQESREQEVSLRVIYIMDGGEWKICDIQIR